MSRAPRRPVSRNERDRGFTLVELLVAMTILTAVLGVFTASFLDVQNGVRRTRSLASAQQQARNAFQLLDRQVRYANTLNDVATVNGSQYVEFQLGDVSASASIPQTCYQWRVTPAQELQWRSFTLTAPGAAVGTQTPANPVWTTLASGLDLTGGPVFSTDPASAAFLAMEPAGNPADHRQLAAQLRVVDGTNPGGSAAVQSLFTAANTTGAAAPTTPVCQQAGRP